MFGQRGFGPLFYFSSRFSGMGANPFSLHAVLFLSRLCPAFSFAATLKKKRTQKVMEKDEGFRLR